MAPKLRSLIRGVPLNALEVHRIQRSLQRLRRDLAGLPEPIATLFLQQTPSGAGVTARVRVRLGHLGRKVMASETAESADQAVRRAVAAITRQLGRQRSIQRGEPTFGVPSRREPSAERLAGDSAPDVSRHG